MKTKMKIGVDLLNLFVSKDERQAFFQTPYVNTQDGYVYSTNGRILIRANSECVDIALSECLKHTDSKSYTMPILDSNCFFIIKKDDLVSALSKAPLIDEMKITKEEVECEECNGEGYVDYEYESRSSGIYTTEQECPICGGTGISRSAVKEPTGKKLVQPDFAIGIKRGNFKIDYYRADCLQILADAMQLLNLNEIKCVYQGITDRTTVLEVSKGVEILMMSTIITEHTGVIINIE